MTGNGTGPAVSDVSVIVEGVRVVSVGDGGKRNKVCEGVETVLVETSKDEFARFNTLLRK